MLQLWRRESHVRFFVRSITFLPSLFVLSILLGCQVVIVYITQICLLKCAHRIYQVFYLSLLQVCTNC